MKEIRTFPFLTAQSINKNTILMKQSLRLTTMIFALLVSFTAWSQMSLPPSGNNQKSEVTQYLGRVKVTINYSSPDVGGREIWGKLVPYGMTNLQFSRSTETNPSPWRAGANENTIITFSLWRCCGSDSSPEVKLICSARKNSCLS